jgi:hypothetical protein
MKITKIILSIFLLFLLASCGGTPESIKVPEKSNVETTQKTPIEPAVPYTQTVTNLKAEYKDSPEFTSCMSTFVNMCSAQAITAIANKKSDEKVCDDMSSDALKNSCRQSVVIDKAKKSGDIKMCDVAKTGKDNCVIQVYTALAIKNNDKKMCDKIKSVSASTDKNQNMVNDMLYKMCVGQVK